MTTDKTTKVPIEGKEEIQIQESRPSAWFEELYSAADNQGGGVPWANMQTHPIFSGWLADDPLDGKGNSALVVGCGFGDDAIELESLGYDVTSFDVSNTAIEYCAERFPESHVKFVQADLFDPHPEWAGKFHFVLEIYTVQAIPPAYEEEVIQKIAEFVAPGGQLLVIAEVGDQERTFENGPPWLLTPQHVGSFVRTGFEVSRQHIGETDENGMTSYVTTFKRPSA
jgi:SAM-dependent methyltransferase